MSNTNTSLSICAACIALQKSKVKSQGARVNAPLCPLGISPSMGRMVKSRGSRVEGQESRVKSQGSRGKREDIVFNIFASSGSRSSKTGYYKLKN